MTAQINQPSTSWSWLVPECLCARTVLGTKTVWDRGPLARQTHTWAVFRRCSRQHAKCEPEKLFLQTITFLLSTHARKSQTVAWIDQSGVVYWPLKRTCMKHRGFGICARLVVFLYTYRRYRLRALHWSTVRKVFIPCSDSILFIHL